MLKREGEVESEVRARRKVVDKKRQDIIKSA